MNKKLLVSTKTFTIFISYKLYGPYNMADINGSENEVFNLNGSVN